MLIRYGDEPQLSQFSLLCNTGQDGLFSNVSSACKRGLPEIDLVPPTGVPALICGGGPSLEDTLESIRAMKDAGAKVFALNNTAKFLAERGIQADYQVIIDPRPDNVCFLERPWAAELLLCSQCHPDLFDRAAEIGYPVRLWHPGFMDLVKAIPQEKPLLVSVSLTVGLSALSLAHVFGHREFHLFGYDSSHREDQSHAYRQAMNDNDEIVRCVADGRVFYASLAMAGQANQFRELYQMLEREGTSIKVHGDGLIPTLWRSWEREKAERILTAVYDLGVSPPTYDFLSFLIEAERYRRANGFAWIDLVFQPGPIEGFRDDELPPDTDTRKGLLWRICVAMAKLLPSVRNVDVKKVRWNVTGDVFPVGYEQERPKSHYATAHLKNGEPMLKSSELARRRAAKRYTKPYATITLRQANYWPDRNSNIGEWIKVAEWLQARGIVPIFVPDADGISPDGFTSCEVAAWDLDMRAALYEGALINLGVLNGPMSLCAFLDCRYLIFNIVVETAIASSTAFLAAHGFNEGDGFGGNGRLVWKPDTAANIIAELGEFNQEKTSHVAAD
jgi:hypothetical protein